LRHAHATPTAANTMSTNALTPTPTAIGRIGVSAAVVAVASSVDSTIFEPETLIAPVVSVLADCVVTDVPLVKRLVVATVAETESVGEPFVTGRFVAGEAVVCACVVMAVVGKAAGEQSCLCVHMLEQIAGVCVVQIWRKVRQHSVKRTKRMTHQAIDSNIAELKQCQKMEH
jgi:hypothetical protein